MHKDPADKAYLEEYFAKCKAAGHRLFDWGSMTVCVTCGSASYIIAKRDLEAKQAKSEKP